MTEDEMFQKIRLICEPQINKKEGKFEIKLPEVFMGCIGVGKRDSIPLSTEGETLSDALSELWNVIKFSETRRVAIVKVENIEKDFFEKESQMWLAWNSQIKNWEDIPVCPSNSSIEVVYYEED